VATLVAQGKLAIGERFVNEGLLGTRYVSATSWAAARRLPDRHGRGEPSSWNVRRQALLPAGPAI